MKSSYTFILGAIILFLGCKTQGVDVDNTLQDIKERISELSSKKDEMQELTKSEIEKLFIHEYKVIELPLASKTHEVQQKLTELGKNRWECFYVEHIKDKLRIFCKRRPKTYLRYVPRFF